MTTLAELLDALRRLHLLDEVHLDALRERGVPTDPRAVAKQLVHQGWLSAFQVNRLFTGRGDELLLGSYVLLELLGEGGMGAVYKARNWKLGQVVALKLIRKERLANDAAVRRFQREIRASAQLDHPNIVRALDADAVAGVHFLVMEYVEGGRDLYGLVKEHGPLTVAQACQYIQQAALGLQQACERGLVHRDIKPHNLLLTNGQVKILDFGLARLGESSEDSTTLTQEGAVMGTLDYLAPEQARDSHAADIRADLYSLGCTLYFLLTGQAPFAGGAAAQKLYRHRFDEPPPMESQRPEVPAALGAVIRKLMAKQPAQRYQTPAALAVDLDAVLSQPAVAALPAGKSVPSTWQSSATLPAANPFAQLSQSETFAEGATAERGARATLASAPPQRRAWVVAVGGGAVLTVTMIVTAVLLMRNGTPPRSDDVPLLPPPAPRKPVAPSAGADAAAVFRQLQAKAAEPGVTFTSFARLVGQFRAQHGGTPLAIKAAELLMAMRSPLDAQDPQRLPQDCRDYWRALGRVPPRELVAAHGAHDRPPGKEVQPHDRLAISPPTFTQDGTALAMLRDGGVEIIDCMRWQSQGTLPKQPQPITEAVCLAHAPVLLTIDGDGTVKSWDMASRKQKSIWSIAGQRFLGASPDGRSIACQGHDQVALWDTATQEQSVRLDAAAQKWVYAVAFAPDGRTVAVAYGAPGWGSVRIYDTSSGRERFNLNEDGNAIGRVRYSPDGRHVAAYGWNPVIYLWDATTGRLVSHIEAGRPNTPNEVTGIEFSPDGKRLLYSNHAGRMVATDAETGTFRDAVQLPGAILGFALAPDGRHVATANANGTLYLLRFPTVKHENH